jgi:hypothetical protein
MEVRVTVVKDPGTGIAGTGASFGSNQGTSALARSDSALLSKTDPRG